MSDRDNNDLRGQLILKVEQIQELKKEVRYLNDKLSNVSTDLVKKDDRISKLVGDVDKYKDVLQTILKANEGKIKFPKESDISMLPIEFTHLIVSCIFIIRITNRIIFPKRYLKCFCTRIMFNCTLLSFHLFNHLNSLKSLSYLK